LLNKTSGLIVIHNLDLTKLQQIGQAKWKPSHFLSLMLSSAFNETINIICSYTSAGLPPSRQKLYETTKNSLFVRREIFFQTNWSKYCCCCIKHWIKSFMWNADHYHNLDCQFITLFCVKKIWNSYERKFEFLRNNCLVYKFRHDIPCVNFINVLRAHFLYKSLWAAFFYLLFDFEFLAPIFCTKNAHIKCWWNWLLMFLG